MGKYSYSRSVQPKFPQISVQNSMDRFGPTGKVFEKTGPPFEVDHFSRSDWSELWLNESRPGIRDWSKSIGGVGRSREGVGHEVLSLVQGVGRAIFY